MPPVSVVFANYSLTGFQPLGSIFISSGNSFYNLPNQKEKINGLLDSLPIDDRETYRLIIEHAVKLGYAPSQMKNVHGLTGVVVFQKSRAGKVRRLCKISPSSEGKNKNLYNTGKPLLSLSFSATKNYSDMFHEAVRQEYETLKGGFKGCKGCNSCASPYVYRYPDGKTVLCCGGDKLMELPQIGMENLDEIKDMMKSQDDFFEYNIFTT